MSMIGGAALAGIGSLVSGFGAGKQAEATNKAGEMSRADLLNQLYWAMLQQKKEELGGAGARQWYDANVPQEVKDRLFGSADYTVKELAPQQAPQVGTRQGSRMFTPGQATQQPGQPRVNEKVVKGVKGQFGSIDNFFSDTTPGYLTQMQGLSDQYGRAGLDALNQSRDIEAQGQSFGQGERARIERDSAQGLRAANRSGAAQLEAAGLGGTSLGASMTQGNTVAMNRARNDALGSLDDRTLQFLTGLRQNTLGLGLQNQNRQLALQQAPIAARMGLSSSGAFNPFLSRDTTQYYPGLSPSGMMMQSFGGTLAGAGGMAMGMGSQGGGGGGGGGNAGWSGNFGAGSSNQYGGSQMGQMFANRGY